jgi:hypothetical protein
MIDIRNPTNRRTECRIVRINGLQLVFSHNTLIGFFAAGDTSSRERAYRLENRWGPTTGRHMMESGIYHAAIVTEQQLRDLVQTELLCCVEFGGTEIEEAA